MGELQALQIKDFDIRNRCLYVSRSYNNQLQRLNETTKTGKSRTIHLTPAVFEQLTFLLKIPPYRDNPESFLFFGNATGGHGTSEAVTNRSFTPDRPLGVKSITTGLYKALKEIGIKEQERQERNITFHSWRHWLNSQLISSGVPLADIQQLTGHMTDKMSHGAYFHQNDTGIKRVTEAITGLF